MNNRNNRGPMPLPASAPEPSMLVPDMHEEAVVEEVKPVEQKPIQVLALRNGFFDRMRIAEGQIFTIPSADQLGSWMQLTDPVAEKARQLELKKKKEAGK